MALNIQNKIKFTIDTDSKKDILISADSIEDAQDKLFKITGRKFSDKEIEAIMFLEENNYPIFI